MPDVNSVAIIGVRGYPSYYGGFETAVRHLVPWLSSKNWTTIVYSRKGETSPDEPLPAGVTSIHTPGLRSSSLSTLTHGASASLHAFIHPPKVALVMNVANGFFLPFLRLRGIPVAVNVDGLEWERAKWGFFARLMFRLGARLTAAFANEIISDSRAIGSHWHTAFRRTSTYIPYGGIPSNPLPIPLGLPDHQYVLMVARLVPENTIAEFVSAARVISAQYPVVIVGSNQMQPEIELDVQRAVDESKQAITWLGHVANDDLLHALWQHAGVYFHGHSVGGTNPALVQAMALGAPTVARDTVYNREVLEDAAEYCSPSPEAIANAVLLLMNDPARRASMSERCIARAATHFTWERVCGAYESTLRRLLPNPDQEVGEVK